VHPWDWEFFAEHRTPDDFTGRFAMAAIEEAGLLNLDPSDHTPLSDASVSVRHAPGHTPGHRVVLLDDGDAVLLLTGDLLHTTPQIAHPTNRSNHDEDPVLAAGERRMLLLQASRSGWSVGVSHFGRPFGRVVGEEGTFEWSPI
jgi:glyoxylase-like metal-dependent hydrolase (beta-lactamase superfamily II)